MRTVRVLFYKGADDIREKFRRFLSGKYSKVEIIVNSKIYSVTPKDGVTCIKKTYNKEDWDIIDIDINNTFVMTKAQRFIIKQEGKKFDYFGATFGQLLGLGFQDENKWFDAELITKFFQQCLLDDFLEVNASKMSLNKLYNILLGIKENKNDIT